MSNQLRKILYVAIISFYKLVGSVLILSSALICSSHLVQSQTSAILINDIAWNSDGTKFAVARDDGTLEIVNPTEQTSILLSISSERLLSVAWSPIENNKLAVSAYRGPVQLLTIVDGQFIVDHYLSTGTFVQKLAWSSDGSLLATMGDTGGGASSESKILIWDTVLGEISATYEDGYSLTDIAWKPQDPARLLITGVVNNFGAEIVLWDAVIDSVSWTIQEANSGVLYIAWSVEGNRFATATELNESSLVRIHDAETGLASITIPTDMLYRGSISWTPIAVNLSVRG